MGRPDFGRPIAYPTPPVAHALHDEDTGDVVEAVDDGLPTKPEPTFPLGCRWRVPLTRVHNPSGVLFLYRDQLDAQTLDQVCKSIWFYSNFIHIHINVIDIKCKCVGLMVVIRRRVG